MATDTLDLLSAAEGVDELESPVSIRFSEIISALSYSLDLTDGQPMGHSARSCVLGMRIAREVGLPARILAVADVFDARSAKRPYRDALPLETVFQILRKDSPNALDASCVEALARCKLNR